MRFLRCMHKNIIFRSKSAPLLGTIGNIASEKCHFQLFLRDSLTNKCEGKCSIVLFILPISTGNLQQKRRVETTAKPRKAKGLRTGVHAYMDATPLLTKRNVKRLQNCSESDTSKNKGKGQLQRHDDKNDKERGK